MDRCPNCGTEGLREARTVYRIALEDEERTIEIPDVPVLHCASCNEDIVTQATEDVVERELLRRADLLGPDDLRSLRSRLGLTQEEMGRLLGAGMKSWCRWESGALRQSRLVNGYLVVLRSLLDVPDRLLDVARRLLRHQPDAARAEILEKLTRSLAADAGAGGSGRRAHDPTPPRTRFRHVPDNAEPFIPFLNVLN